MTYRGGRRRNFTPRRYVVQVLDGAYCPPDFLAQVQEFASKYQMDLYLVPIRRPLADVVSAIEEVSL